MTSTCSQSAPRSTIRWHSSASLRSRLSRRVSQQAAAGGKRRRRRQRRQVLHACGEAGWQRQPHLAKSELRMEGLIAVGGRSLPDGRGARAMLLGAGRLLSMLETPRRGCCTHSCKQVDLLFNPPPPLAAAMLCAVELSSAPGCRQLELPTRGLRRREGDAQQLWLEPATPPAISPCLPPRPPLMLPRAAASARPLRQSQTRACA